MSASEELQKLADMLGGPGQPIPDKDWDARVALMWAAAIKVIEAINEQAAKAAEGEPNGQA
jgi:hypothetical protein